MWFWWRKKREQIMATQTKSFYSDEEKNPTVSAANYAQNYKGAVYFAHKNDSTWTSCRNAWFSSDNNDFFFFTHDAKRGENIASFIHRVEFKLRLKEKSVIGKTKYNNISWVQRSSWWTKGKPKTIALRKSLFTALLRCGHNYDLAKRDFEKALFSTNYTKNTKKAVEAFFGGSTIFHGREVYSGWTDVFGSGKYIENLKKPKTKEEIAERSKLREEKKKEKERAKEEAKKNKKKESASC